MSDFEIPERCQGCPQLELLAKDIDMHQRQQKQFEHFGTHLMGEEGQAFDAMVARSAPAGASEEDVANVQRGIRQNLAEQINELDEHVGVEEKMRKNMTSTCLGKMLLRAKKDNFEYTVAICRSEELYEGGKNPIERLRDLVEPQKASPVTIPTAAKVTRKPI